MELPKKWIDGATRYFFNIFFNILLMSPKKNFFWEKFPTSKNLENMRTLTDIKKRTRLDIKLKNR